MEEKQLKNTQPTAMTDKGPNGTTRTKSKDGKYTANPNYQGEKEERKPSSSFDYTNENFSKADTDFDQKISTPLFLKEFGPYFLNKYYPGEGAVLLPSTNYEDHHLGIDLFLGNASEEYENLIDEPGIDLVDLKTIKEGLGNKEFFEHPKLTLTLYKMHKRKYGEIDDLLKNHMNTHFAFQVLYSEKKPSQINSANDIKIAKCYLVGRDALEEELVNKNEQTLNTASNIFARRDIERPEIEKELRAEFGEGNVSKEFDESNGDIFYRITLPEYELILNEETSGDRQLRIKFPARMLKENPNLNENTRKVMMTWQK